MEILWIIVLAGYAICVAQSILALTSRRPVVPRIALASLAFAFGAHTGWLLLKGIRTGRCPLVGTEEMCAFLSWCLVIAYIIAARWYRADALKAFIFPIVLVLVTIAAISPDASNSLAGQNNPFQGLLFVHAGFLLLAYAAFFVAFGSGLMYLIQERELKSKKFGPISYRLPSLETCDKISFKSMAIGFIFLTLGIAAGIGWQRARDGVYWHGEPTEIFSVFSWVIYLLIIQTRMSAGWRGRTVALASIISFMLVIFSLVGVRYLDTSHPVG